MPKKIIPTLIFILLLLGMAYFPYLPIYIFNIDLSKLSTTYKIIYNVLVDILFMLIIFIIYHKDLIDNIKDYKNNFKKYLKLSIKYYLIGLALMELSNFLIVTFFKDATAVNENTIKSLINVYPLYMFFSVSIYAPFIEETIFRKSVYDSVIAFKDNKFTKYLYIIISGLIFASLHVVGLAKTNVDYLYIIPYLSFGIAFASLYYKTKNIFTTIVIHSIHNTIAIILYLLGGLL